jgi:hypothetical protein
MQGNPAVGKKPITINNSYHSNVHSSIVRCQHCKCWIVLDCWKIAQPNASDGQELKHELTNSNEHDFIVVVSRFNNVALVIVQGIML